ncbi:MAG: N-acetylneuraminate synthase [Actinobacteria bacterium]|nr:MAG: N-acetylneuraminate synthase [Actinomycetota bacterium]
MCSGAPIFVIAEAGVNHNGDIETAHRLVDTAAKVGADAVKFQTFTADRIATHSSPLADYQREGVGFEETMQEMLSELVLSPEAHRELKAHAEEAGVVFLSSPFDEDSADFLAELGVSAIKLGSGELTNTPLLRHVAAKGLPVILSTGMGTLEEVREAVRVFAGTRSQVALMHCTSSYPTPPQDANMRVIRTLMDRFALPVGYSDHTEGHVAAVAATALGVCILEKHLTLDRTMKGPDHRASADPDSFADYVEKVREAERCMGSGEKQPVMAEFAVMSASRKSIVAARDISKGSVLTSEMLTAKRPGTGISPAKMNEIIGRRASVDIPEDTLISESMIDTDA